MNDIENLKAVKGCAVCHIPAFVNQKMHIPIFEQVAIQEWGDYHSFSPFKNKTWLLEKIFKRMQSTIRRDGNIKKLRTTYSSKYILL